MARELNGTSDYLEAAQSVATPTLCVAAWVRNDSTSFSGDHDRAVAISDRSSASVRMSLGFNGGSGERRVRYNPNDGTTNVAIDSPTGVTTGWHHIGFCERSSDRDVRLDGVVAVSDSSVLSFSGLDTTTIGAWRSGGGRQDFWDGALAEIAAWTADLNDADWLALAAGHSPLMVRPESLVAYWPLIGRYSPEIDPVGGFDMTVTGATAADHPRIIYPKRRRLVYPSGGAPQPSVVVPPHLFLGGCL